jgi:hypothetical protein
MTGTMASHSLDSRSGLPDSFAYLRATYPQASWQQHGNFGGLASHWLQIHDALRAQGAQLLQATDEFRAGGRNAWAFRRYFAPRNARFLEHLKAHHHGEDYYYFPRFRALDQRMVAGFDLLEGDHKTIHEAIIAAENSAQTFLESIDLGADSSRRAADSYSTDSDLLRGLLFRHLADEEDLIVPALLHYGERSVT